jgi:hypothetical protein
MPGLVLSEGNIVTRLLSGPLTRGLAPDGGNGYSATAANVQRTVERLLRSVRIGQAFLRWHLIGARLAMSPGFLPHRLLFSGHRRRFGRHSRTSRRRRGVYVRLWQRCDPASIAYAAGIDCRIVYSTSVRRTARNTADRHISRTRRTGGSRKCSHCRKTRVSASVSASASRK